MESVIKRTFIERGFRESTASGSDGMSNISKSQPLRSLMIKREDEKRELQELNDKFATYLSRVRYLENQNRKLEGDLDDLRSKWGFESDRVREHFDNDLNALRRQIDEATKEKAFMELRLKRAIYDSDLVKHQMDFNNETVNMDKQKLNSLQQLRESLGTEIEMLESKYRDALDDITRYRSELNRLLEQLEAVKNELDAQSLSRVQLQNDLQTLEDQLAFTKAIHEDELNELRLLSSPSIDTSQFYRAELAKAISDIRRDFEQLNREQQAQLEEYYKIKTEEVREQVTAEERKQNDYRMMQESNRTVDGDITSMRHGLTRAREEMTALQRERVELETRLREIEDIFEQLRAAHAKEESEREIELQRIRNEINDREQAISSAVEGNVSLRFEINTYRRLLECEETRLTRNPQEDWKSSMKAERISVHKSARGPVCIEEIDPSGSFITLMNTSTTRSIDLKGWCIRRKIDQQPEIIYYLPVGTIVKPLNSLRIYSNSNGGSMLHRNSPDRSDALILADMIPSWSLGNSTITKLIGDDGQEKAVYYQRIGG